MSSENGDKPQKPTCGGYV